MDKQIWEKAVAFHGHTCPGLAMGVRAAVEAIKILDVDMSVDNDLYCVVENSACYIDGIQLVAGCTLGKGNLAIRNTGKSAFNFYSQGKAVRLIYIEPEVKLDRPERIEQILNAPIEQIYSISQPKFPRPEKNKRKPLRVCAVCGESASEDKMLEVDGKYYCADCK